MPAYVGDPAGNPHYSLYAVETDRRVERVIARGRASTIDWFIDADARPFIREDFDNHTDTHRIWAISGSQSEIIYEKETERRTINPIGLTADRRSLIYEAYSSDTGSYAFYTMNTENGEASGPVLGRENSNIDRIVMDINRVVYGVEYEGFFPTYRFFSPALTARMEEIQTVLPGASVRLVGWSEDFDRLVVHASGGWTSGIYLLFTEGEEQPGILARQRPTIAREQIAHTIVAEYVARDGLTIPAIVPRVAPSPFWQQALYSPGSSSPSAQTSLRLRHSRPDHEYSRSRLRNCGKRAARLRLCTGTTCCNRFRGSRSDAS